MCLIGWDGNGDGASKRNIPALSGYIIPLLNPRQVPTYLPRSISTRNIYLVAIFGAIYKDRYAMFFYSVNPAISYTWHGMAWGSILTHKQVLGSTIAIAIGSILFQSNKKAR